MIWLNEINEEYECSKEYNKAIENINKWSPQELYRQLKTGKCPNPVHLLIGVPLGMYHCELCGNMVVAGCGHGEMLIPFDPVQNVIAKDFVEEFNIQKKF